MPKIGPFVTIPTGSYCNITLDSGEKIVASHEHGAQGGSAGARLTVERLKLLGFTSETIMQIPLDGPAGQARLAALTTEGATGSPLQLLVATLRGCRSVAEVVARGRQLAGQGPR